MTSVSKLGRIAVVAAGLGALIALGGPARAEYPDKPIRFIVPTDAGGAMDTIARLFQREFDEQGLLPQKVVIVNMAGAGGGVGTRAVKDAEPDGYTIGFWHDGLITSAVMGVTDYDHTAFEIIGNTGMGPVGIGVKEDSPYKDFGELIAASKANPNGIRVATNIGLPVHFVPLMLAQAAGVEWRFVQSGGGAKRLQSVLGGHTELAQFSPVEFAKFGPSGLRPILMLWTERDPTLPDVPTAKELGIDLAYASSRIWMAPKGTPKDRLEILATAFRKAMEDEDVKQRFHDMGMTSEFSSAEEVTKILDDTVARVRPLVPTARELQTTN